MKIQTKIALCIIFSLIVCSVTQFFISRYVVKSKINDITKSKLDEMAKTVLSFIEKDKLSKTELEDIINKRVVIGKTGFVFVIDTMGNMVIHKKVQGKNWLNKPFIKHIVNNKNGYHRYLSPETGTYKVASFSFYKPREWIVVASSFENEDISGPLRDMATLCSVILIPLIIIMAIGSMLFLRFLVMKPINRIIDGLGEGSEQVAAAAVQISSSSQTLSEGSSQQAASIEEASSAMEEMASMTKKNAENAKTADSLMTEAKQVVTKANDVMTQLTTSMRDISKAGDETSKIIKTIDAIAFQTNLLALNAAVEAARAGEAGAGFAVVADEVRSLAMRASEASKNTAELIEGTIKKVNDGSVLVEKTNDAFSLVSESAQKAALLVSEIAAASQEQSNGIEQVNTAINEMDKVVQMNAANAEESASASEEMSAQAKNLNRYVSDLVGLIVGNSGVKEVKGPRVKRL